MDQASHIEVEAEPRYWGDASVNGVYEDDDAPTIYGVAGRLWKVRIDLVAGRIEGWPAGMLADIHYKVCDQGEYWLADATGTRLAKWRGYYVPGSILCPGGQGYGDYIIMSVGEGGQIADWHPPEIDAEDWITLKGTPS